MLPGSLTRRPRDTLMKPSNVVSSVVVGDSSGYAQGPARQGALLDVGTVTTSTVVSPSSVHDPWS